MFMGLDESIDLLGKKIKRCELSEDLIEEILLIHDSIKQSEIDIDDDPMIELYDDPVYERHERQMDLDFSKRNFVKALSEINNCSCGVVRRRPTVKDIDISRTEIIGRAGRWGPGRLLRRK